MQSPTEVPLDLHTSFGSDCQVQAVLFLQYFLISVFLFPNAIKGRISSWWWTFLTKKPTQAPACLPNTLHHRLQFPRCNAKFTYPRRFWQLLWGGYFYLQYLFALDTFICNIISVQGQSGFLFIGSANHFSIKVFFACVCLMWYINFFKKN